MSTIRYILLSCFVIFFSCQEETKVAKLLEELPPSRTGIDFTNQVNNQNKFNIFSYRNFYNGGGVAIGDVNNDGLVDVYMTANMGENKLYLNTDNFNFNDVTNSAGVAGTKSWSTGVTMADINDDGWLDIYVCNAGYMEGDDQANELFINNQDGTFTERATEYGIAEKSYTTHAAFFDYDKDGDLDLYLLNNSFIPVNTLNYSNKRDLRADDWDVKDFLKGGGDKFFKNENGQYVDVSEQVGIYGSLIGFGLGVTVGDVNNDSYLDLYISNDFFERDYLYINDKKGGFTEELKQRISHISHSSMGADMADINNDGAMEIFVTDMLPDDEYRLKTTSTFDNIDLRNKKTKKGFYNQFMHNTLQLNDGEGRFKEVAFFSGVAASDWSWGALMFDIDNDSNTDLLVCNGIYNDVIDQDFIDFFANEVNQKMALSNKKENLDAIVSKMPSVPIKNKVFKNIGNMKFADYGDTWGLDKKTFSNGAAYGDLDNDGDLDLVINNLNQPAQIIKNNSENNYIAFDLKSEGQNKFCIGTRIDVFIKNKILTREIMPARGFQSSVDYRAFFGLSDTLDIDSIHIRWHNGTLAKLVNYQTNTINKINLNNTKSDDISTNNKNIRQLFSLEKNTFKKHQENNYIDFYYERNIPLMLSKEGPCSSMADYNSDGFIDLFIGGADGQAAQLYKGTKSGFEPTMTEYFAKMKGFEDTASSFFDADGDGDLDLLIGSGGNNINYAQKAYRDRLYINQNGSYELNFNAIPPNSTNTSVVAPYDFNGDGAEDLFVGSRSIPGQYGVSPGSFMYINTGKGQFHDVTKRLVPELSLAGMVTDALWVDLLPQAGKELIIVGEWMSPKILSFNGKRFNIIDTNLDSLAGLWQSIQATDLDNDGDNDLVIGNIGENFYLKANRENPLLLWINDFDNNNSLEKIITRKVNNKDMPVAMKRDLTSQIVSLKKQNLLHSAYANKSIQELFSKDILKQSTIKQVNFMSSVIAINDGQGNFDIQILPAEAQLSCINEIVAADLNADDFPDLILSGNNHGLLPQFSMLDANQGLVLYNINGTQYAPISNAESGLDIKGVTRSMEFFDQNGVTYLLACRNDDLPLLYKKLSDN